jgi:hypothetical protein
VRCRHGMVGASQGWALGRRAHALSSTATVLRRSPSQQDCWAPPTPRFDEDGEEKERRRPQGKADGGGRRGRWLARVEALVMPAT